MKPLFILMAHTGTGAIITIVALLLIAVIIGYFTAWYYAKSVYTPVIEGLEAEKVEFIKQVAGLKDDKANLNEKIDALSQQIVNLGKEIEERDKEIDQLKKPIK
jgi:peptidoglycan hydrolase CwlO-like protein